MERKKRILVGTTEICRYVYDLADGFRSLGHHAETVVFCPNPDQLALQYDLLDKKISPFSPWVNSIANPIIRYPRGLANSLHKLFRLRSQLATFDEYVFIFGGSLLSHNRDYPLLKSLGRKIACFFVGDDIRHWSAAAPVFRSFGMDLAECYKNPAYDLIEKLTSLRMAEKYADLIIAQPTYAQLSVRPYMHCHIPLRFSLYRWHVPGRDVPVVIHAPTHRGVKGTEEILATLQRLKSEGVQFELRLLEGRQNHEVIEELAAADVIVDQLGAAIQATFALEGLATGCAVAGGNHPGFIPIPPNRPVLHIDSTNVYPQLKRLLTDRDLRLKLAHEGRPFAEKHHDHVQVADYILRCMEMDETSSYDYYPTYFARDYHPPNGVNIPSDLKRMTAQIVQRWGLPEGVDPKDMIDRGLMSADGLKRLKPIPRWTPPSLGTKPATV